MPPVPRPFPRFIADSPQEAKPYGRWEERLATAFANACEEQATEAGASLDPQTVRWFPDRTWGGRAYVPATGRAGLPEQGGEPEDGEQAAAPAAVEYFGRVSFERSPDGEPGDLRADADFT